MSITIGDILRVVAVIQWVDGDIMQNVFNAVITGTGGPYTDGDIVDDAVAWMDEIYANFTATATNEMNGSEVRLYKYDAIDDDWDEVGSDSWTWNPGGAGEYLPRGVAGLINCKTTDPDVNGKKYFGGLTEAHTADGLFIATWNVLAALMAADWLTAFVGGTSTANWQPGVWSVVNTNFFAATGTAIIPTIPAYQRRRKDGIGI